MRLVIKVLARRTRYLGNVSCAWRVIFPGLLAGVIWLFQIVLLMRKNVWFLEKHQALSRHLTALLSFSFFWSSAAGGVNSMVAVQENFMKKLSGPFSYYKTDYQIQRSSYSGNLFGLILRTAMWLYKIIYIMTHLFSYYLLDIIAQFLQCWFPKKEINDWGRGENYAL